MAKTVLITGANQGIGFETAIQLAERGYFVYLGSRSADKGIEAQKKLNSLGIENIEFVAIDVTNLNSILLTKQTIEAKSK